MIEALDPLFRVHMSQPMLRNHDATEKSASAHGVRQAMGSSISPGSRPLAEFGAAVQVDARGALTYGDVLARGGDYFGPVVNLAARLGHLAAPGELLATAEFVDALQGALRFEPAGRRQLKGLAEPVPTVSLIF